MRYPGARFGRRPAPDISWHFGRAERLYQQVERIRENTPEHQDGEGVHEKRDNALHAVDQLLSGRALSSPTRALHAPAIGRPVGACAMVHAARLLG